MRNENGARKPSWRGAVSMCAGRGSAVLGRQRATARILFGLLTNLLLPLFTALPSPHTLHCLCLLASPPSLPFIPSSGMGQPASLSVASSLLPPAVSIFRCCIGLLPLLTLFYTTRVIAGWRLCRCYLSIVWLQRCVRGTGWMYGAATKLLFCVVSSPSTCRHSTVAAGVSPSASHILSCIAAWADACRMPRRAFNATPSAALLRACCCHYRAWLRYPACHAARKADIPDVNGACAACSPRAGIRYGTLYQRGIYRHSWRRCHLPARTCRMARASAPALRGRRRCRGRAT